MGRQVSWYEPLSRNVNTARKSVYVCLSKELAPKSPN